MLLVYWEPCLYYHCWENVAIGFNFLGSCCLCSNMYCTLSQLINKGQILHIRSSLGLITLSSPYLRHVCSCSRVAQWERAGPITQRSMDRNHSLLYFFAQTIGFMDIISCLLSLPSNMVRLWNLIAPALIRIVPVQWYCLYTVLCEPIILSSPKCDEMYLVLLSISAVLCCAIMCIVGACSDSPRQYTVGWSGGQTIL